MAPEANAILKEFRKKNLFKLKKLSFFKNINNTIELNQEEILVAIGMIMNPIFLKNIILIKIFKKTEIKEI